MRRRWWRRQRGEKRAGGLVGDVPELKGHGGAERQKHQTRTPTGFRQTGFSQSAMETTDTPHDAWMTKARKVYFSANSAGVWPQVCGDRSAACEPRGGPSRRR